jgi:transcriptional regulator with XRE-family HTH domain
MRRKRDPRKPNIVDIAVGRNVRIWRMARGLTQAQLAKRLRITFQQVQKYETGGNRVPTGRLVRIADILGVPISALFEGTAAGAGGSQELLALVADRRSYRLAIAFAAIDNNRARESLVNMVEKIAEAVPQQTEKRRRR